MCGLCLKKIHNRNHRHVNVSPDSLLSQIVHVVDMKNYEINPARGQRLGAFLNEIEVLSHTRRKDKSLIQSVTYTGFDLTGHDWLYS